MIKIENWSTEDIEKYSRLIGEAFAASPGIAETIPHDDLVKSFEIITEFYYRMGTLYTTSEKYEGFLAYWDKNTSTYFAVFSSFFNTRPPNATTFPLSVWTGKMTRPRKRSFTFPLS